MELTMNDGLMSVMSEHNVMLSANIKLKIIT